MLFLCCRRSNPLVEEATGMKGWASGPLMAPSSMSAPIQRKEKKKDEPTWRCHQNPFIGALGIQEPVIPGEPLIKG